MSVQSTRPFGNLYDSLPKELVGIIVPFIQYEYEASLEFQSIQRCVEAVQVKHNHVETSYSRLLLEYLNEWLIRWMDEVPTRIQVPQIDDVPIELSVKQIEIAIFCTGNNTDQDSGKEFSCRLVHKLDQWNVLVTDGSQAVQDALDTIRDFRHYSAWRVNLHFHLIMCYGGSKIPNGRCSSDSDIRAVGEGQHWIRNIDQGLYSGWGMCSSSYVDISNNGYTILSRYVRLE